MNIDLHMSISTIVSGSVKLPAMTDIPDLDVLRAAALLIRQHGEHATARAVDRARELAEEGDEVGAAVYVRIVKAISQLRQREPDGSVN
jgi:hypothetical protein